MTVPANEPNGQTPPSRGPGRELRVAGAAVSGAGAALVATAAAACCAPIIAPLVVGVLGASGAAWAAGLNPYSGWLLAGSAGMLALGFWSAYRPRPACDLAADRSSARRGSGAARAVLWVAALLWAAAVGINLLAPS